MRQTVALVLLEILPVSLAGQSPATAILRSNGPVRLNQNAAPSSAALYSDDMIETPRETAARIEWTGSAADLSAETMVKFEGDELVLDHGRISMNTSRGLRVRVGCITVIPVKLNEWTRYDVTDVDGKVKVSALQSDVNIETRGRNAKETKPGTGSKRATVREGEEKTRDEKCGAAYLKDSAKVEADGAILNSPWAIGAGLGGIVALTCFALCRSGAPISPSSPQ